MKPGYLRRAERIALHGESTAGAACGACRKEHVAVAQLRQPWYRCVHCGTLYCYRCATKLHQPAMADDIRICALCYGPTRPL